MRAASLVVTAMALACVACRDAPPHAPQTTDAVAALPAPAAAADAAATPPPDDTQLEAWLADDAPPLPFERLGIYLRATAVCQLGEYDVDPSCPAYLRYGRARRRVAVTPAMGAAYGALGRQHLAHPAAVVRMLAAHLCTAAWPDTAKDLLQRADVETEPLVLRALLVLLAQPAAAPWRTQAVQAALPLRGHPQLTVRVAAWQLVAPSLAAAPQPLLDALAQARARSALADDPDSRTEAALLCQLAYRHAPLAMAASPTAAALEDRELHRTIRGACAEGAAAAVCAAEEATPTREAAAVLLLGELTRHPRSDTVPAWQAAAGVCSPIADGATAAELKAWHEALRALVEDDAASGFARAEAVKAAKRLGAPRAWFEAWRERFGRAEFGAAGMVRRAVGEASR